jgi:hypothetical protein
LSFYSFVGRKVLKIARHEKLSLAVRWREIGENR